MSLPQKLPYPLLVTSWAQTLDPIVANPILQGLLISDVALLANTPKLIQTGLGRLQQGWFPIDKTSNTAIWRTQPFNAQTLTLESSANTTISIWVF